MAPMFWKAKNGWNLNNHWLSPVFLNSNKSQEGHDTRVSQTFISRPILRNYKWGYRCVSMTVSLQKYWSWITVMPINHQETFTDPLKSQPHIPSGHSPMTKCSKESAFDPSKGVKGRQNTRNRWKQDNVVETFPFNEGCTLAVNTFTITSMND